MIKRYFAVIFLIIPALFLNLVSTSGENTYTDVTDGAWMVPVSDEQIELMDKYLTKFMSN